MTLRGEGGLGRDANFSMNFGPFLNCSAPDSRCRWSKRRSLATPIKFDRCRSTKLACLITWFFVYEVQNIQLKGLPQKIDVRDIFCILKLFKFDKISLNWFHDVRKSGQFLVFKA